MSTINDRLAGVCAVALALSVLASPWISSWFESSNLNLARHLHHERQSHLQDCYSQFVPNTDDGGLSVQINQEEETQLVQVLSEDHGSTTFLSRDDYQERRVSRARSLLETVTNNINNHLEQGDAEFQLTVTETDVCILNAIQTLLLSKLKKCGYTCNSHLNTMDSSNAVLKMTLR